MKREVRILEESPLEFNVFDNLSLIDTEILERKLCPPLPVKGNVLVWGFGILKQAAKLGIEKLAVVEVEGSPADLLCLALKMEGRCNHYSWAELIKLGRFVHGHDCSSRLKEIERLVQPTGSFLKRVAFFESLDPGPQQLVLSFFLDLKTAGNLRNFSDTACAVLIEKASALTTSERRNMITYVNEAGLRNNLDEKGVADLVEKVLSTDDPLQSSYTLRYPSLSAMENTLNKFRKRFLKGTGLHLLAPPAFEGDSYQMTFRFGSRRELGQRVKYLERITDKSDEIFDLLF